MSKHQTIQEWREQGEFLFGKDGMNWKFKCPFCGNIASPNDFEKYKENGAKPDSATQCCIGRFAGCDMTKGKTQPCDWAAFGLFRGPNFVEFADGHLVPVFEFAPVTT